VQWQVRSGRNPTNTILTQSPQNQPAVIAGTPFWFSHTLAYDLKAGTLTIAESQ
jgi:hypothetical protein